MEAEPLKVHQIAIQKAGGYNLMSKQEFLAMPLGERVQLMLQSKVQFLDELGEIIPVREALKVLND